MKLREGVTVTTISTHKASMCFCGAWFQGDPRTKTFRRREKAWMGKHRHHFEQGWAELPGKSTDALSGVSETHRTTEGE